ncbi:type II toxin-antitoxin system RelE/ParE family toxin [Roseateles sp. L2-2]|uniref:type II toxin-antitoxin system RelE/ParE family toxin n=1 Tax=Roseateles TaxID=93681 RepID=UPI003D36CADE
MERGLIDANLGSGLFKKRIGRSGAGKREGYRVIVARHPAGQWFFVDGYAKNELENIEPKAFRALREEGVWLTGLSQQELAVTVGRGQLKEVKCDEEKEVRHR